jgi:enterochelin esterase-like enzyme
MKKKYNFATMPFESYAQRLKCSKKSVILLYGATFFVFLSCSLPKSRSATIQSSYYTDSIFSVQLNEYRLHNIYLPAGFNEKVNYPILYTTDGAPVAFSNFLKISLDSLISNQTINHIIVVVSHCNQKIADSTSKRFSDGSFVHVAFRNYDYIRFSAPSQNPNLAKRFMQHLMYFTQELIPTIESQLNQKPTKLERYFYGVSNGAGFGISMMNLHPEIIGTYICFSPFGAGIKKSVWNKDLIYPKLIVKFGSQEKDHFHEFLKHLNPIYENCQTQLEIEEYEGGHDLKIWNKKLLDVLVQLFAVEKH